jgi:hypothetical protein
MRETAECASHHRTDSVAVLVVKLQVRISDCHPSSNDTVLRKNVEALRFLELEMIGGHEISDFGGVVTPEFAGIEARD